MLGLHGLEVLVVEKLPVVGAHLDGCELEVLKPLSRAAESDQHIFVDKLVAPVQ